MSLFDDIAKAGQAASALHGVANIIKDYMPGQAVPDMVTVDENGEIVQTPTPKKAMPNLLVLGAVAAGLYYFSRQNGGDDEEDDEIED